MKRPAVIVLLAMGLGMAAMAEEVSGYIADSNCAAKQGAKAASDGHAECAAKCIKGGAAAVLVTPEGKVYKLDDQDKVKEHAGHKVTVSGTVDGGSIKVESIKM
jgi:hypothetical protein